MSFEQAVPADGAFTIGFIAALGIECTSLRRHLPAATTWLVMQSGPGAARAGEAARRATDLGAGLLVSWGFAGGLGAAVAPGTVVLPRRVLAQGAEPLSVDAAWHARLATLTADVALDCGDLLSAPAALESPGEKRAAAAASGAVAVDMESAAIGSAAARAHVPFVVLRVVIDGCNDALPAGAERWIDDSGNRRMTPAMRASLDPRQWPALLTLTRRYRVASRALDRVARALAAPSLLGAPRAELQAGN
jgi:adenosylhomocysteine nucleosidase